MGADVGVTAKDKTDAAGVKSKRVTVTMPIEQWETLCEMATAEHRPPNMQLELMIERMLCITRIDPAEDAPLQQLSRLTGELVDIAGPLAEDGEPF